MIKVCVIGCGDHSSFVHGPSYKKYAEVKGDAVLSACCDLNREAASKYAEKYGFLRTYGDYLEMLHVEKPDAVDICMPLHITESMTLSVLALGIPCIVEKPPALEPEGVRRIITAAREANVPVRVAFNRRFMPLTRELVRILRENPGDRIQLISCEMHRYKRGNEDFSTTALHGIDLVRHVSLSEYETVDFQYAEVLSPALGQKATNVFMHCKMRNFAIARLNILPLTGGVSERLGVQTDECSYFMEVPIAPDSRGSLKVFRQGKLVREVFPEDLEGGSQFFETNGFYNEISSFLELIHDKKPDTDSGVEDSLQSVEVSVCVRQKKPHYQLYKA